MTTTRATTAVAPRAPRAASAVVTLRPRSLARRAEALRADLHAGRTTAGPAEEVLLDILDGALARTERVAPGSLDAWARMVALLEEHRELSPTLPALAAVANLVALALLGDGEDHVALSRLAAELGHERLARLQHRYGTALETDARLPVSSQAVRRMLGPGRPRRPSAPALRAAHALLVQGVDRSWTVPRLESVEELVDIAVHGTITEWRHHVAMVIADPWSPYPNRLVELARQAGGADIARVVSAIVALCREQAAADDQRALRAHRATRRSRHQGGRAAP